jgi:hypothetical protein
MRLQPWRWALALDDEALVLFLWRQRPGKDYPGAHSHDTTWFAIDSRGHVGVFSTGEDGPCPLAAEEVDFFGLVRALRGEPEEDEEEDRDWDEAEDQAAEQGVFIYHYVSWWHDATIVRPYSPAWELEVARHVDQLPPRYRELFKRIRLDKVNFEEGGQIPLTEQFSPTGCYYYYDTTVAYLAADEKTVRPVPGKETEYREFVQKLIRERPDQAGKLHFEGLGP